MKLFAPPDRLVDAMAPLMIVNYLMGLRIFEYPRGQRRILLSLIYLVFLLGVYFVSLYQQFIYFSNIKLLKLEFVLYVLFMFINTFVVTYEMFMGWCHTKRLNVCYRKISKIDETLRQLGSTINYNKMYYITIGTIISWSIFIFFIGIWNFVITQLRTNLRNAICVTVSYTYGISVSSIVIFEFLVAVKLLKIRFELVNELLSNKASWKKGTKLEVSAKQDYAKIEPQGQNISVKASLNRELQSQICKPKIHIPFKTQIRSFLPSQLQKQFQMELQDHFLIKQECIIADCRRRKYLLQTIKQVHLELSRISKELSASFGIRISQEVGLAVMFLTGMSYTMYVRFVQRQNLFGNLMEQAAMTITLCITYILKVVFINRLCKLTALEGNKTTEIIHTSYGYGEKVDIRDEIQQFSLQILQSPVIFTGFGFPLDYTVLTSCLTAVTTYIVIMVQVSNSLESDDERIKETGSS